MLRMLGTQGSLPVDLAQLPPEAAALIAHMQQRLEQQDRQLAEREFVADTYSIADIAIWPWVSRFAWQGVDLNQHPNVKRWYEAIAQRPAVRKGYDVPKQTGDIPMP